MLYIKFSEDNNITEIDFSAKEGFEEISLHDPRLSEFIEKSENSEEIIRKVLSRLDLDMVRTIEDVIDILIDRNVMLLTDLPDPVQNKILFKKTIRNLNKKSESILDDQDYINF